jgi:hypothetical protein
MLNQQKSAKCESVATKLTITTTSFYQQPFMICMHFSPSALLLYLTIATPSGWFSYTCIFEPTQECQLPPENNCISQDKRCIHNKVQAVIIPYIGNPRRGRRLSSVRITLFLNHETPPHAPNEDEIVQRHVEHVISACDFVNNPTLRNSKSDRYVPICENCMIQG